LSSTERSTSERPGRRTLSASTGFADRARGLTPSVRTEVTLERVAQKEDGAKSGTSALLWMVAALARVEVYQQR
jgi:hypothetical protein